MAWLTQHAPEQKAEIEQQMTDCTNAPAPALEDLERELLEG